MSDININVKYLWLSWRSAWEIVGLNELKHLGVCRESVWHVEIRDRLGKACVLCHGGPHLHSCCFRGNWTKASDCARIATLCMRVLNCYISFLIHRLSCINLELRIMYTWAEEPIQVTKERERSDLFNSSKVKCGLDRIDLSFGKVGSNFSYTSFIIHRIKMSHVHTVSARHVVYCNPFPQKWLLYVHIYAYQKFHKWPPKPRL